MTQSSWERTKQTSQYHFDTAQMDPRWDTVQQLGHIEPIWEAELAEAIQQAPPVTWRTRNMTDVARPESEHAAEEYDLEKIGMNKDSVVTNLTYKVAPVFQHIADQFALDDPMVRVHVQWPGQVWNLHIDRLQKWNPGDPSQVVRYFVQLTDWAPGHFWNYGNYQWGQWRAGNVSTFDWINVPHCTANAGNSPRATLQITGVVTEQTTKFLTELNSISH
jgi:hypothetical protein